MKFLILVLLFSVQVFALESYKIERGRYVAIENNVLDANKTTLIFLPGVFRGLDLRDTVMQQAQKMNMNFVSIHFSLHPESILQIPANETPYHKIHSYKVADLAQEVLAIIKVLKLKKPVIVGLSYSSAITSELAKTGKFPLIIETAPMIQFDESDPTGSQITSFWKNYLGLNPIFGAIWSDLYLQQVYETYWTKQVDSLLQSYPQYAEANIRSEMISSYARLSVMVDGFNFLKQNFNTGTKRIFILGENEEENRSALQTQAIKLYETQTNDSESSIVVKGAAHIVPSDAPKAYLKVLKTIVDSL